MDHENILVVHCCILIESTRFGESGWKAEINRHVSMTVVDFQPRGQTSLAYSEEDAPRGGVGAVCLTHRNKKRCQPADKNIKLKTMNPPFMQII